MRGTGEGVLVGGSEREGRGRERGERPGRSSSGGRGGVCAGGWGVSRWTTRRRWDRSYFQGGSHSREGHTGC